VNGRSQTISFANQQCTVTARYGNTDITVTTGGDGKALQVTTDFTAFHAGATANHLAHNNTQGRIGAITVKKGTQTVFTGTGNGGTRIVVHYQ
jgi:hypothetical protein